MTEWIYLETVKGWVTAEGLNRWVANPGVILRIYKRGLWFWEV